MDRHKVLILALFVAAVGCSSDALDDPNGDGWQFGDDTGTKENDGEPDAGGHDAGPEDGGGTTDGGEARDGGEETNGGDRPDVGEPPSPVTFRITNEHGTPVFAYANVGNSTPCGGGAWLEILEDGRSHRLTSDCTRCSCSASECVECAFDCAPGADPDDAQLSSGESRRFVWDGLFRIEHQDDSNGTCETTRPPETDVLVARFCWGHSWDTTEPPPWGEITSVECADVEFSPDDDLVEYTIQPTTRDGVSLRMRNETGSMLYANYSVQGVCDTGEWVRLSRDGEPLRLRSQCGTCRCTEVDTDECPIACPTTACLRPGADALELPDGAERTHHWNRVAYFDDTVDGAMCERDRLVTGTVTAEFCWSDYVEGDQTDAVIVEYTCDTVTFDPFDTRGVTYVITSP